MSMMYCEDCGQNIDTDFDAEHFDSPHLDESGDIDLKLVDEVVEVYKRGYIAGSIDAHNQAFRKFENEDY